jgi:tRNA A-37 threonylcarbamoyl transferase component Bud32
MIQGPQSAPIYSEEEIKERELELLLHKLPPILLDEWREKVEAYDSFDDGIALVRDFLAKRSEAKEKIFTTIGDIEDPSLQEEVRRAVHTVETTFGSPDLFVGNGSVAEVYFIPQAPHVCVKYLVNPDMAREHGNNFREESQYLSSMHNFSVDGIRTPKYLFYHSSDFGTCFGMEKIEGRSINLITKNPEDFPYINVLKKQNQEDVLRRMRNFITQMHQEKKIVHRDLTDRNIMVDKEGNWYVIDFGRARPIEIGDDSTDLSEASDFPSAEGAIRALFAKLKTLDSND